MLGNREGSRVTAEQVISGATTRVNGTIESVDAARNELTVKDAAGKIFTVAVGAHTTVRRITPEVAQAMQQRAEQRRNEAAQNAQGGAGDRAGAGRRENAGDGNGPRRGEGGDGAGRRRGFGGGQQGGMFGNLPAVTLAELKKGDGVMITGTPGADAAHVTASSLTAGDAQVFQQMQQRFRRGPGGGQRGGAGAGLPGGGPGEGGGGPERP